MSGAGLKPAVAQRWAAFRGWFMRWQRGHFVPLPSSPFEWFVMRALFAALVWYTFQDTKPFGVEKFARPTGLARFFDLGFLTAGDGMAQFHAVRWIVGVALVVYVVGLPVGLLVSLPVLTLCSTLVRTLANSQGHTHHGFQIVTLTLLAQTLVVWVWAVRRWRGKPPPALPLRSYMIYYSQGLIAATYVLAAVTKIINSKGLWLWNSRYIASELIKSHRSMYYKGVGRGPAFDPALAGDVPVATWMLKHPLLTTGIFGAGFFLELFALLALRNRAWALGVGLSLILMHQMIQVMMKLTFHNNEILILIFLVNIPFWLTWGWTRARGRDPLDGANPT